MHQPWAAEYIFIESMLRVRMDQQTLLQWKNLFYWNEDACIHVRLILDMSRAVGWGVWGSCNPVYSWCTIKGPRKERDDAVFRSCANWLLFCIIWLFFSHLPLYIRSKRYHSGKTTCWEKQLDSLSLVLALVRGENCWSTEFPALFQDGKRWFHSRWTYFLSIYKSAMVAWSLRKSICSLYETSGRIKSNRWKNYYYIIENRFGRKSMRRFFFVIQAVTFFFK